MLDITCDIRRAGITPDGRAQLDLKSDGGQFDWTWLFSTPERAREVLAVALAAIASNKHVYVTVQEPVTFGSVVQNFGLVR